MGKKRKTTEALVTELREFHHNEAADRLEYLDKLVTAAAQAQAVAVEMLKS